MEDTLGVLKDAFGVLDRNRRYVNLSPYGEPQLGKRGLYDSLGGRSDAKQAQMAMLWVLNLSDGEHSLLDIAERAGLPFDIVDVAARALHDAGLVKE
jgi:aminopeptidase-like protein